MPRKSRPRPGLTSKTARKPRSGSFITGPSAKRPRIHHENDASSDNPESAQPPPQTSEIESPAATSPPYKTAQPPRVPLPPPPSSVSSTYVLLPPEADDAVIREKWDMRTTSLGGAGAKIEGKVRQVLTAFRRQLPASKDAEGGTYTGVSDSSAKNSENKHVIVALTARAPAGNKCISVAEIVKRNLFMQGVDSLWQYTGCWTRLETYVPPKAKENRNPSPNGTATTMSEETEGKTGDTMVDEEEVTFETMQLKERKFVRNAVCLVIYLAMQPVSRLREVYGEQVLRAEGKKA
ncbi:hypothetical protein FKW77_001579 [Venturia effusa]|uniref:DNA/RNA-binding protein Alba-like domain-containing protein n=1 Tax=Venturia effusa TaxID=50376 RepID=A0A517LKU5_9PEZI|nr:hypothetical protein FKW77_001579 [Venturia effusa]